VTGKRPIFLLKICRKINRFLFDTTLTAFQSLLGHSPLIRPKNALSRLVVWVVG
jgi:hypothetical protein